MTRLLPALLLFLGGCGCEWEGERFGWGDERDEGCNTCVCEPDGGWSCERLACLDTGDTAAPEACPVDGEAS